MICKWFDVCPLRNHEKEGRISDRWKNNYCKTDSNWKNCKRFQLEENNEPHSNNLLPNGEYI